MAWLKGFTARVAGLFGRDRRDAELLAEIESHLAMHTDENLRRGMSEEEAVDFFEFNVAGAYMGPNTPMFVVDREEV